MPSLKTLLLSTILSLAATTTAFDCPSGGWVEYNSKCCYGSVSDHGNDNDAYCCVSGPTTISTPPVLPTGVPSMAKNKRAAANSCIAKIPFTASDFSSLVSSASAKAAATTTGPSTNEASGTTSGSASPTTNAAMPVAMADGIGLSGAAVAAALFML